MNRKTEWSGKSVVLCTVACLWLFGLFMDFVPAPFLHGWQWLWPMLLTGIVLTAWLFVHAYRNDRIGHLTDGGLFHIVLFIVGMPLLLAFVCWSLLTKSLPWAITRMFGEPFHEVQVMQTHYRYSRRSCDHRLQGEPMERASPAWLCIDEAFYRLHPEKELRVVLVGKRTFLGDSIIRVELPD